MRYRTMLFRLAYLLVPHALAQACPDALPDTMQAVRVHQYGGADAAQLDVIVRPQPGAGQVLVAVHAASVNPIDWKLREGMVQSWWPLTLPAVLGRDASGEVVAIGPGVDDLACGDAVVVALSNRDPRGTYAEYVVVERGNVAPKPVRLSFVEAAAYPLVAMTAWNAVEAAGVEPGQRVLVQGGAGGVGSIVIQLAKARGAHVVTTASARNEAHLLALGADQVVDYRSVRFEDVVDPVDAVIDAVGGETTARSVAVVRRGGRLVTFAGAVPREVCAEAGIACVGSDAGDPADSLAAIGALFEDGTLKVNVEAIYPLQDAAAALERNRVGRTRGKLVLQMR